MKSLILLALLLLPCTAHSADVTSWSVSDSLAQVAVTTVTALDWGQTRYISSHPTQCQETNLFLGQHPTLGQVDTYFVSSIVAEAVLAYTAPHIVLLFGGSSLLAEKARVIAQGIMIGCEVADVGTNFKTGVQLKF